jgi:DNA-binding NarL/FixJ family response regulator
MSMSKPRVLLADDHAMVLTAFHRLIEGECEVVGQVSDGGALVTSVPDIQPDVIVLDISMPVLNGLEAARRISGQFPHIRIVFLTMHEDRDLMLEAFKAGASGYLLKRSAASELILAIREVVQQRSYVTPLLGMNVIRSLQEGPRKVKSLTPRQRELLQLFASGASMKEAAATLRLSPRTVAFHKYKMMKQIEVRTTAELIRYAVERHLV